MTGKKMEPKLRAWNEENKEERERERTIDGILLN